ncbi:MAG: Cytidylate kinase [Microgenomates bacterium OLB23]|nr:MAG: Cytidylate kinase [Microgenomates bacterium OLB23]
MSTHYKNITISGKIGVGSTTLAKKVAEILGWKYINTGALQREFDRQQGNDENLQGAAKRSDEHERAMEAQAKQVLSNEEHVVYEAWLSGFVARDIPHVLKVLVVCSKDDVRIDRVMNRENVNLELAKQYIRIREGENIEKWKALYGTNDFWNPKDYDLVVDTYLRAH